MIPIALAVVMLLIWFFRPKTPPDPLDKVLHTWPSGDSYTVRHTLTNLVGVGATGSGKSSGTYHWIMKCLLGIRSGGVIFGSKPEEREETIRRFRDAGRLGDLIIFSPTSPARFNLLSYEQASDADARALTQHLMVAAETLEEGGQASDPFWKVFQSRVLWSAIELLRQSQGTVTAPDIARVITEAAYKPTDLPDPDWLRGFHAHALASAQEKPKSRIEQADFDLFWAFWTKEFPSLDDKPRSSVLAGLNNTLMTFNSGVVREILSTETTTTPDDLMKGKWWYFDFPVHVHGPSAKFLMSAVKMSVQKAILRRHAKSGEACVYLVADEAHNVINSFDSAYMAESRSHLGGTVYLTQSLHSFHNSMESHGHHKTLGMLTNFSHMLVNTLGDYESAKYFSDLLGQQRETFVNVSMPPPQDVWEQLTGTAGATYSVSSQYCPVVQIDAFLTGLRNGGKANDFKVDAILIRAGQPFKSGSRTQYVTFSQR